MKQIQQAKAKVKVGIAKVNTLIKKQKYSHIVVDISDELAWVNIQVKTESNGVVVSLFNYKGEVLDYGFHLSYDEIKRPLDIVEDK